ncbi:hypothetical protein EMCRGX_G030794 [Ephydatia muelleri]|eukprot:Em0010g1014a
MSSTCSIEESRQPKGAVLFTGPDSVGNLRVSVKERRFVGHGALSPEASGDTQYIMRGASTNPHPVSKNSKVGEIGWGVPKLSDYSLLKSGNQMTLGTFRQQAEDRHSHLYQEPYYPVASAQRVKDIGKSHGGTTQMQEDGDGSENVHSAT